MIFTIVGCLVLILMWHLVIKSIKEHFKNKEIEKVKIHVLKNEELSQKLNELARGEIDSLSFEFKGKRYHVKQ